MRLINADALISCLNQSKQTEQAEQPDPATAERCL